MLIFRRHAVAATFAIAIYATSLMNNSHTAAVTLAAARFVQHTFYHIIIIYRLMLPLLRHFRHYVRRHTGTLSC